MTYPIEREAPIVRFVPADGVNGALAIVRCPICPPIARGRRRGEAVEHVHGLGPAGVNHRHLVSHRSAHCLRRVVQGYTLTDPHQLVPARDEVSSS